MTKSREPAISTPSHVPHLKATMDRKIFCASSPRPRCRYRFSTLARPGRFSILRPPGSTSVLPSPLMVRASITLCIWHVGEHDRYVVTFCTQDVGCMPAPFDSRGHETVHSENNNDNCLAEMQWSIAAPVLANCAKACVNNPRSHVIVQPCTCCTRTAISTTWRNITSTSSIARCTHNTNQCWLSG